MTNQSSIFNLTTMILFFFFNISDTISWLISNESHIYHIFIKAEIITNTKPLFFRKYAREVTHLLALSRLSLSLFRICHPLFNTSQTKLFPRLLESV